MEYFRLQAGCLIIVLYIAFVYFRDCKKYHKKLNSSIYDEMLILCSICIIFDGITAVTVNYYEMVSPVLNKILHMFFLIGLDTFVYMLFRYMLKTTGTKIMSKWQSILLQVPYYFNIIMVVLHIDSLEFREGVHSNYSMGVSAYTCFIIVGVYMLFTLVVFFRRWNYIEESKRISILTFLLAAGGVTVVQAIFPELLFSSVAVTLMVLGVYMNQEDPTLNEISRYLSEMVMGFATLVESKDGSTGGHVKRTTEYVKLLTDELRARGYYKEILTKDYCRNLRKAAPMHDIGKISVPDVVLQKPGRLTEEEFEIIKKHAPKGGEIIQETFGHLGNEEYTKMAYQVARYHHEKWNGKGYPEGLKGDEIPLCARIMAVADVFDAISEKRCYRDAMPLDKCFSIIREGSGQDFDPIVAEVFLDSRDKVEKIHREISIK